ncbi:hypothetical protein FACS189421_03100 [Bacteroidia bacterium]|nr:hypothetical protein FACS189421_03100 [Bacteroidia bacterium]
MDGPGGNICELNRGTGTLKLAEMMAMAECFRDHAGRDYDYYPNLIVPGQDGWPYSPNFILLDSRLSWDFSTCGYIYEVEKPKDFLKSGQLWTSNDAVKILDCKGFVTPGNCRYLTNSVYIYMMPAAELQNAIPTELEIGKMIRTFASGRASGMKDYPSKSDFRADVNEIRSSYTDYIYKKDKRPELYIGLAAELPPGRFIYASTEIHDNHRYWPKSFGNLNAYACLPMAKYMGIESAVQNYPHRRPLSMDLFFHIDKMYIFLNQTGFLRNILDKKINVYRIDNRTFRQHFTGNGANNDSIPNPMFDRYVRAGSAKILARVESFSIREFIAENNFYQIESKDFQELRKIHSAHLEDFLDRAKAFEL